MKKKLEMPCIRKSRTNSVVDTYDCVKQQDRVEYDIIYRPDDAKTDELVMIY